MPPIDPPSCSERDEGELAPGGDRLLEVLAGPRQVDRRVEQAARPHRMRIRIRRVVLERAFPVRHRVVGGSAVASDQVLTPADVRSQIGRAGTARVRQGLRQHRLNHRHLLGESALADRGAHLAQPTHRAVFVRDLYRARRADLPGQLAELREGDLVAAVETELAGRHGLRLDPASCLRLCGSIGGAFAGLPPDCRANRRQQDGGAGGADDPTTGSAAAVGGQPGHRRHHLGHQLAARCQQRHRRQIGGQGGNRGRHHHHRQHAARGTSPLLLRHAEFGQRIAARRHRFGRDQEDEEIGPFDGLAQGLVEGFADLQVGAVHEDIVALALEREGQALGERTLG